MEFSPREGKQREREVPVHRGLSMLTHSVQFSNAFCLNGPENSQENEKGKRRGQKFSDAIAQGCVVNSEW